MPAPVKKRSSEGIEYFYPVDDIAILNAFGEWLTSEKLRRQIVAKNPALLYWAQQVSLVDKGKSRRQPVRPGWVRRLSSAGAAQSALFFMINSETIRPWLLSDKILLVTTSTKIKHFLRRFWPRPVAAAPRQILVSSFGAAVGLLMASLFSHWALGEVNIWFIAPMGASAVLLFAAPNSPLAQPWSVIGGNFVSALAGLTVVHYVDQPVIGLAIAAGLSVALMFKLRCLHPPGGAIALTTVLGGHTANMHGYHFAFAPVLINSVSLTFVALIYNNLTGRRYPHPLSPADAAPKPVKMEVAITRQDLHEALMKGEFLDIDEEDLQQVLQQAEDIALARQAGKTFSQQMAKLH